MLTEAVGLLLVVPIYIVCFLIGIKNKISLKKHILVFILCLYIGGVIAVTLFPLPFQNEVIEEGREMQYFHNNFIPFFSLVDIIKSRNLHTIIRNILGNIILTIPLGILIPMIIRKMDSVKRIFILSLSFSIVIELTQFIISSILGYTYKITDVDDIFLNIIGVLIGYICFKLIKFIIKK